MPKKKTEKPVKTVATKTKKHKPRKISAVDLINAALSLGVVQIHPSGQQPGALRLYAVLKDGVVVTCESITGSLTYAVWHQELYFEIPDSVLSRHD